MKRYSRQTLFEPIGKGGQKKIMDSHLLIIGVGALGAASAEMFARSGVGKITLCDRDYVEASNLQRQPLYDTQDAREKLPKAIAAKRRLEAINPHIEVEAFVGDVTREVLEKYVPKADVIIDGTDNFEIRMMMNDAAQKYEKPWIYGSCVGSYGISYMIMPKETPCLHCLINEIPLGTPTCDTVGIIQPAATEVVIFQVTETLKYLVGDYSALNKKLKTVDLWKNEQSYVDLSSLKKAECKSCGPRPTYPFLNEEQTNLAVLCGRDTVQIRKRNQDQLDLISLQERFKNQGFTIEGNEFLLSLTVEEHRIVVFKDGRALIHGTKDKVKARSLYDRYFA